VITRGLVPRPVGRDGWWPDGKSPAMKILMHDADKEKKAA